jgi:hypothetical protein
MKFLLKVKSKNNIICVCCVWLLFWICFHASYVWLVHLCLPCFDRYARPLLCFMKICCSFFLGKTILIQFVTEENLFVTTSFCFCFLDCIWNSIGFLLIKQSESSQYVYFSWKFSITVYTFLDFWYNFKYVLCMNKRLPYFLSLIGKEQNKSWKCLLTPVDQ